MAPRAAAWVCVGDVGRKLARGSQRGSFEPCWAAGDEFFGSLCSFAQRAHKHTPPRNRVGMGLRAGAARGGALPWLTKSTARQTQGAAKARGRPTWAQSAGGAEP